MAAVSAVFGCVMGLPERLEQFEVRGEGFSCRDVF